MRWPPNVVLCLLLGLAVCVSAGATPAHPSHSAEPIPVHVWPHSHDDVGWLKTVDQYFTGSHTLFQHAGVRWVLDSVFEQLQLNDTYTFNVVEQAFFQMWYSRLTPAKQMQVQQLVRSGQLNFLNGGYCMHDEAAPSYSDMIDQTTLGHKFLQDEFGFRPRVGWQIDPFGHSSAQASLLSAAVGFDAIYYARIEVQEHEWRQANKALEFAWRTSPSLGPDAQVLAGASFSGGYDPPTSSTTTHSAANNGFFFDVLGKLDPVVSDPSLDTYNLPDKVSNLTAALDAQYAASNSGILNFYAGSDFNYEAAREWYASMDALMEAVNAQGKYKLFYSTPDAYTLALHRRNATYTVKTDDHFPYAWYEPEHTYWTGFFTSRPALKRFVRESSGLLHAARQMEVISRAPDASKTRDLWEQLSIAQHHDAVSGTARQHVTDDYTMRLSRSGRTAQEMMAQVVAGWVAPVAAAAKIGSVSPPQFGFCNQLNISVCAYTQGSLADDAQHARAGGEANAVSHPSSSGHHRVHRVARGSKRAHSHTARHAPGVTMKTLSAADPQLSAGFASAVAVVVHNGLLRNREVGLQLPLPLQVDPAQFALLDETLRPLPSQVEQVLCSDVACTSASAQFQLRALVDLQPLSFRTFFLVRNTSVSSPKPPRRAVSSSHAAAVTSAAPFTLSNGYLTATFSAAGLLTSLTDVASGETRQVTQELMYWQSFAADVQGQRQFMDGREYKSTTNKMHDRRGLRNGPGDHQNSGAYIFREMTGTQAVSLMPAALQFDVVRGPVFDAVVQRISPWLNQTFRLFHGQPEDSATGTATASSPSPAAFLEHSIQIGSIPIEDGVGKELISRFSTSLQSGGVWAADSNGRDMVPRQRNVRPFPFNVTEPVSANYVPVTAAVALWDEASLLPAGESGTAMQLTVLVDRAEGCSSLADGTLEVMLHRRVLHDDAQGVAECLNETAQYWYTPPPFANPTSGSFAPIIQRDGPGMSQNILHRLGFAPVAQAARAWRPAAHAASVPAAVAFAPVAQADVAGYLAAFRLNGSFAAQELQRAGGLPPNVELLTLQLWDHDNTNTQRAAAKVEAAAQGSSHAPSTDASTPLLVLLRLTHLFAADEDAALSQPVSVDLSDLLAGWKVLGVSELSLTANVPLEQLKKERLHWSTLATDAASPTRASATWPSLFDSTLQCAPSSSPCAVPTFVTLAPMQVRTYEIEVDATAVGW